MLSGFPILEVYGNWLIRMYDTSYGTEDDEPHSVYWHENALTLHKK